MRIRRRSFLALALTAPLLSLGAPTSAVAAVDPMTALSIANTALSVMRSFSSGGNGLEAMLQAQNAKLNLIIDQLAEIQGRIVALQIKVEELDQRIPFFLRASYRDTLISGLSGSAERYANVMGSLRYDPSYLDHPLARSELDAVFTTAAQRRADLQTARGGLGPEAACIMPLALALEVAAMARLGYPNARILSALDGYSAWMRRMRSDEPEAIWDEIKRAREQHDAIIDRLAKDPLGKRLNVAAAKMGSPPVEAFGRPRDPCSLVCSLEIEPDLVPVNDMLQSVCPRGWGIERTLNQVNNQSFGVRTLSYDPVWEGVIEPTTGDICTGVEAPDHEWKRIRQLPESRIKELAQRNMTRFDTRRTQLQADIANLNYYRMRAGYCVRANGLLDQAQSQIQDYRSTLGTA